MAKTDASSGQLSYFKSLPSDGYHRRTINDRIRELALEAPDNTAFVFRSPHHPRSSITRQEFLDKITLLGLHFVRLGIKPGDKVAILMPSSEYFLIIQFGLYMAGAVAVNSLSQDENEFNEMATSLECAAKIVQKIDKSSKYTAVSIKLSIREMPTGYGLGVDVTSLLQGHAPKDVILPDISPDARAMLVLTSGSTGVAKLVSHTHSTLLFGSFSYTTGVSYNNSDIVLNDRPMQWIGGYPLVYLGSGATVVYVFSQMGKSEHDAFYVNVMTSEKATSVFIVEYRLNGIVDEPKLLSKISQLRRVVTGGQRITTTNVQRMLMLSEDVRILYGSTESLSFSTSAHQDTESFEDGTAGVFGTGTEAKIVDSEGLVVPFGTIGELHIRSDGISKEYVGLNGETNAVMDADNWYQTGDMATMDVGGAIIIKGRMREMIKRATVKISPTLIERKLREHLAVQEVIVVGIPHQDLYEEVCACFIVKPGSGLTLEDIRVRAEEIFKPSLAPDGLGLMPGHFLIVDDFPRTLSGKCSRPQLAKKAIALVQSSACNT